MNPSEQPQQPWQSPQPSQPQQPPQSEPSLAPQQSQQPIQPMQPITAPAQMPQQINSVQDPGSTLGLIGLITAFLLGPLGVILSAIGLSKSRKAGFKNTKALVGIIIGSVMTVLIIWFSVSVFSSVNSFIDNFKKDCDAKNGTVQDTGGGTYKCEYKIYQ